MVSALSFAKDCMDYGFMCGGEEVVLAHMKMVKKKVKLSPCLTN
jgi:hypothetical protein